VKFRLFPQDFEGVGCYRLLYPYGMLEAKGGHEVVLEVGATIGKKTTLPMPKPGVDDLPEEDVFVFQIRLEDDAVEVAKWLKEGGKTVVCEIDDWWWDIPKDAPAHEGLKNAKNASLDNLRKMLCLASLVTVSTPRLAELVSQWNENVHILPNYLKRGDWSKVTPAYEKERGPLRIGWMGRRVYRGNDFDILRGIIGPWLERNPDCVFVQVGDENTSVIHDAIGVPKEQRLSYQGQTFPNHAVPTSMIDVGVVPLTEGDFNECKSHLKGMEYAACGIPCIASPTGPYREWVDGRNGLLAKTPKEWFAALDEMKANWRQYGAVARERVQGHFIDERWPLWHSLFASTVAAGNSNSKATSTSTSSKTLSPTLSLT
jgi:hypothetical protein